MIIKTKSNIISFSKIVMLLSFVLLLEIIISLGIGRYSISPFDSVKIIASHITHIDKTWTSTMETVVMDVRLPRIILAIFVGAGLSISGASFQGIFKNPLVSQDIMGVSAAAGFGAALAISLNCSSTVTQVSAFTFGIIGVAMAYFLSRVHKTTPTVMMILSGVVISSLFNAFISLLKYLADPLNKLPAITFWLMGSLSSTRWEQVKFAAPLIMIGVLILVMLSWRINLLSMGDEEARTLGVPAEKLKAILLLSATLITATCVCVSGTIGWVGLIIPHVSRMIVGPDHKKLLIVSTLVGGCFLLLIDNLTRTLSEASIPLGILTAIVGAPFFAILLRKTKGEWSK